ncbi:MAG: hypothetical protein AAGA54_24800 [Myxococcota bacterium]
MVLPNDSVASPFVLVRRRDLVEPPTLAAVRDVIRQAAPLLSPSDYEALCQDVLYGRVLIARRSVDERCDTAEVIELTGLAGGSVA